jgi:DNA-binding transcriptional ArsR family regulator
MGERLLDANRTIGQPNKITVIFGRRITKQYRGKLQTVIEDMDLPNPVIRSHYGNGFVKQYVRDHLLLRTEPASNNVNDYGCKKAVENLPQVRKSMSAVIDNYHNVQQDILETFVDRGQLRRLAEPTVLPNGKRIPGLKLDHPRQLALMHALVRFSHIAAQNTFTTSEVYADTLAALEVSSRDYSLASLRYDLSKLRAKGLVEKVPRSRRYRLLRPGYSVCLVFLKLFEKIYAPLTAGLLSPVSGDTRLQQQKRSQLDRLYLRVTDDLNKLMDAVGLKAA